MSLFDDFKKEFGDFNVGNPVKLKTEKIPTHPRDNVIKLIDDNIKLLGDHSYVVKGTKGVAKKPEVCFEIIDQKASIWLTYSRQKLDLFDKGTVISNLNSNHLVGFLTKLRGSVANGDFDAQLEKIKSLRSEAQKKSKANTAKKYV